MLLKSNNTEWLRGSVIHCVKRRGLALGTIVAVLVLVQTLALQGWNSRMVTPDQVLSLMAVKNFLLTGHMPDHGCVNSLACYHPPSLWFLLIPGEILFQDPTLIDIPAIVLLFAVTLAGVYAVGNRIGGTHVALLAVLIYGCSAVGLRAASSLFDPYPQAFSVWIAYGMIKWVGDKKSWGLFLAVAVFALGIITHFQGLLLLPMFLIIWIIYRPPLRWGWICGSIAVAAILWMPYLKFEHQRHYADIKAQLTMTHSLYSQRNLTQLQLLMPGVYPSPSEVATRESAEQATSNSSKRRVLDMTSSIWAHGVGAWNAIGVNAEMFNNRHLSKLTELTILATGVILFFWVISSRWGNTLLRLLKGWRFRGLVGICLCGSTLVINPIVARILVSRDGHLEHYSVKAVLLGDILLLMSGSILLIGERVIRQAQRLTGKVPPTVALLGIIVTTGWLPLLYLTGDTAAYRYSFLWPLQLLLLICGVSQLSVRPRTIILLFMSAGLCVKPVSGKILKSINEGWSGKSDLKQALDEIGRHLQVQGESGPSIGYQVPITPWVPAYSVIDSQYRVGMGYDLYLRERYSVDNQNHSLFGISDIDTIRLLSRLKPQTDQIEANPINFTGWRTIYSNKSYTVYCRTLKQ